MAKAGYAANTEAAVSLTGGAAKTVIGVLAPSGFGVDLKKFRVSFLGITASAVPALIEVCHATFATNPPGTNSTSVTVDQVYGRVITPGFTAARNWTTEPTVLTPIDEWTLTPAGGLVVYDWPLGDTPDSADADGFAIRINAPANVDCRASLWFERC